MKKIIGLTITLFLLFALAAVVVFADASGEMYEIYEKSVIVNNTWEYVESEKTLYIRSKNLGGYNETGLTSYDEENKAWEAYRTKIEHVVLVGTFNKCSNGAFKNHTALKDIRITSETTQFDSSCFEGCKNLESITVGDNEHIKGYADLSNASILRGSKHFYGTNITKAYFLNDTAITGNSQFNAGITIYAPVATNLYRYFEGTGLYSIVDNSPVDISIIIDGETITKKYPYGTNIVFPTVGDDCVVLYRDAEFTEPYFNFAAVENITLYGRPLIRYDGAMVRSEEYHGLRMIYSVDGTAIDIAHGYEIKEYGAIAIEQNGIGNTLTVSTDGAHKMIVYSNGNFVGKLLSVPSNVKVEYAYTAVGFENDGELVNNAEQNIYFRGYIILIDPVSGDEVIGYTKLEKVNLADACKKTLEANEESGNILDADEVNFISSPLEAGATGNYVYTKEELITVLNKIYNDTEHYMPGQHIGSSATPISIFLDEAYKASGSHPAIVEIDLMDHTGFNDRAMSVIAECKEYIEMGGIVAFSYHMENPTGNYTDEGLCRGELGGEDKWIEVTTDGTALNKRFNEILDYAAVFLNEFDKDGYPVIWRPLHENNGDWFWWCAIQTFQENGVSVTRAIDQEIFINLWKYVYHYFTDVWGMKNLVWAYSPNVTNSDWPKPTTYGYPGDEYCDIVGTDWYTGGNFEVHGSSKCYEALMKISGKPVALTEFGPSGDLKATIEQEQCEVFSCRDQLQLIKRMMENGLKLTYVLNWNGQWSMTYLGYMDAIMDDETALDVYEVKELFDEEFLKR